MINTVSITDLKQKTADVMKRVKASGEPVIIIQRSEPTAVLVDADYFKILEQALEDLEDLRSIEERKDEPIVPFEKYYKKRFSKTPTPSK